MSISYIDGAFEKRQRTGHTAASKLADQCTGYDARIKLGHAARAYPDNAVEYFKGSLQRITYWERALLGWEVEAIVRNDAPNIGKPGAPDTDGH